MMSPNLADHYSVSNVFETTIEKALVLVKFQDFSSRKCDFFMTNVGETFSTFHPPLHSVDIYTDNLVKFYTNCLMNISL